MNDKTHTPIHIIRATMLRKMGLPWLANFQSMGVAITMPATYRQDNA